jgi:beta-phosphoglucomutase-like phosphatase (HAD superfamily)
MLNTLEAKVLAALVCFLVLVGAGVGVYAEYEHSQAQDATISALQADNKQEKANTAAALGAAQSLAAALDAKAAAQAAASQTHTATVGRLAAAVAASPAVASTVVPESYWSAIYGSPNAK